MQPSPLHPSQLSKRLLPLFVGTLTDRDASFWEIDGALYAIEARTDSIGTRTATDDVGLGEAAKVGAGAAVGALAGRLIGGNRTGTLVGAAVGTAAGVGVAMATRGDKVMLDAGAPVRIILTAPFVKAS